MIRFRTLGTIAFDGLADADARRLLAQPHRLAVLTVLLLGGAPGEGVRRDRVVSMFWPGADRRRAYGALRSTVHFLRSRLGGGALASRAGGLVVTPCHVECDAVTFRADVEAGRWAEALSGYEGDLLPGLAPGVPRFEAWLDETRAELRRQAAEAAWQEAGRHERAGHWIAAVDHARRATRYALDGEGALRRLMRLMERAGDRVAALREYEAFRRRWAHDPGLEPSPETVALAASLRGTSRATPVSAMLDGATNTIAVLPFSVSGNAPAHQHLAVGLAHEWIASLSRLSGIRVVASGSVERFRHRTGLVPPAAAAEVGADIVLHGSIHVVGERVLVTAKLGDARTGRALHAEVYDIARADVLALRRRIVEDVLGALHVPVTADLRAHFDRRPTTHPAAYEQYLAGRLHWARRSRADAEVAIERFHEAIRLDPAFALAHAGLADACLTLYPAAGVRAEEASLRARAAAGTALALDPSLGEAHATLGLLSAVFDGDWRAGEAYLKRAIELTPGYATAHHWYGAQLCFGAQRIEESLSHLRLARLLDPFSPIIRNDTALVLLHAGRTAQATAEFRAALDLDPDFWRAHFDYGVARVLGGAPEAGVAHLVRAWQLGAYGAREAPDGADWRATMEARRSQLAAAHGRGAHAFEAALLSVLLDDVPAALTMFADMAPAGAAGFVAMYRPAFDGLRDQAPYRTFLERAGLGHLLADPGGTPSPAPRPPSS